MEAHQATTAWQVQVLAVVLLAAAVAIWSAAVRRLLRRGRLLPQWPRRPVPWTLPLVLATMGVTFGLRLFAVALVQLAQATARHAGPDQLLTSAELAPLLLGDTLGSLVALVVVVGLLVTASRASSRDLGWNPRWLSLDLRLGLLAFAAVVVPVYALHLAVQHLLQSEKGHPLIEALAKPQGTGFLVLVFFSAVVVAPVLEELLFRVVLQGWLESALGCLGSVHTAAGADSPQWVSLSQEPLPAEHSPPALAESKTTGSASRQISRRCWMPIVVSAGLFGLVHWGHGAAPVALTLLGVTLGYLYQRTGRLVPCVTLHMVFNALGVGLSLTVGPSL